MRGSHPRHKTLCAKSQRFGKICPEECHVNRISGTSRAYVGGQHRGETQNVISPIHAFDLWQIGFVEVIAVTGRLKVYAPDFDVERIFLWRDDEIGAVTTQFAIDLVPDVGGD